MVLPLALMVLALLTTLVVVYLTLATVEPQIAQNLTDTSRARAVAEAGIEYGFNVIAGSSDWSVLLATGGVLASNIPVPGLTPAAGTFTVSIRNDTLAADAAITGVALDTGGATTDTNGRLIMTAVSTLGRATRTIIVVVGRAQFPPFPGALVFPGNEAEAAFTGNSFEINGNDTNLDGTAGTGQPVSGISVSSALPLANPGANEAVVENALSAIQKDNVTGKRQNPALLGEGNNTVAPNAILTPAAIAEFIAQAKAAADVTLESAQPSGLSYTNIGSTCASNPSSPTCWGTRENPKVVYVHGSPDPTSAFSALQVSGNSSGAGILIVEDGDFRISGNFTWEGPIIVTGNWVGIGYLGGGFQQVLGAVISNETATDPGFREGVVTGNAKIKYSTQALANAQRIRKLVTMYSWREG